MSIWPFQPKQETLENGLKVILVPMESPGIVTYFTVVRTGSRDEVEPGRSGFAHFFEHMMFRGTKKYPAEEYDRLLTERGTSRNAFTTDDFTAYYVNMASEDLPLVIELESDRFQNLSYDEAAFQTEAGAVYGEYRKGITSPFELLDEKVRDLAFDKHTYKHTTIGFERDIQAMPKGYQYSLSFFQRFYRPDNCTVIVAGDFDPARALALIRKDYGGWARGYQKPDVPAEPPQTKERTAEVSYPGRTLPIFHVAYKGAAFDPKDRLFVAAVLLNELAFGETSALYKELYVKEQKVQRLSGDAPQNRDAPLFEITAVVKDEKDLTGVRDRIYATLDEFGRTPVDAARLAQLKQRWKYRLLTSFDTSRAVAGAMARAVGASGGIESIEAMLAAVEKVTQKDIMDAARAFYTPERRTAVVLRGTR